MAKATDCPTPITPGGEGTHCGFRGKRRQAIGPALKVIGTAITIVAILAALFVLWAMRKWLWVNKDLPHFELTDTLGNVEQRAKEIEDFFERCIPH